MLWVIFERNLKEVFLLAVWVSDMQRTFFERQIICHIVYVTLKLSIIHFTNGVTFKFNNKYYFIKFMQR